MKKIIFTVLGTVLFTCVGLFIPQITAKAATPWQNSYWNFFCSQGQFNTGCQGYYSGQVSSCFTSSSGLCTGDDVLLGGVNVSNASGFTGLIQGNLFNGGTPKAPSENSCGAAFIINMMLGHGPFGSNCAAGIAAAAGPSNSTFNYWVSLVNSYQNSTDPNYGVTWSTTDNPAINSSWWPDIGDEVFHSNIWHCNDSGTQCGGRWEDTAATGWVNREVDVSIPVVRFYFPGGSFEIEMWCGNLVGSLNPLKIVKQPQPHGSISITCSNPSAGQYDAIVNYGDSNGFSTSGTISSNNGWNSGNVASGSTIPIPTSYTNPYSPPPPVVLTVSDNGTQTQYSYSPPPPANCMSSPTCNLALTSPTGLVDPYTPFSITASVTYNPSQGPPTPPSMNLAINNPSGAQAYNSSQNVNGNSPTSVTFSISALANGTGNYTANGTLTSQYFNTITCNTTIPVVNLPYLQVYGGDTMIGTSPDASTLTCDQSQSAGIYSWNRNGSPDYSGAGDQFAVQTLGQINGYASAQSSTSSPPVGLSLANTVGVKQGQGLFGGSSGTGLASSDCDFTSDLNGLSPQAGNTVSVPSSVGGSDTIYATGNVYIGNNVIYNGTGGWANVSDIPYFKLIVVGGNIYIGSNVTELDGLYVAEPLGGNGGTIFTCATGGLPSPAYSPSGTGAIPNYYSTCNKQLTIDGSFVAQQVEFLRTYGTAGQADYNGHSDSVTSNYAGEVFDYTPEMWLPRDNSSPSDSYTAITGLPPEL